MRLRAARAGFQRPSAGVALCCALLLAGSTSTALRAVDPVEDGLELYFSLEPSVIGLDETATLTLEARGAGFGRFQADPDFTLDNLTILYGPHRSSSFNYVNGTTSRSLKYSWTVQPSKVGSAAVTAATVEVRGKAYRLPDRTITVQAEPTAQPPAAALPTDPVDEFFNRSSRRARAPSAEPEVFLRALISPTDPYVGQQVTYTIYLYSQTDITSTEAESLPEFQGVWVHDVPQPRELRSEVVEWNGKRYGRVALMQKVLIPLRSGTIDLEPAGFRLLARLPDTGFFGPLMTRSEPIRRRSNPVSIDVRALPPAPPGFTGAVGELTYDAELSPASIEEGEAATLVVRLSGPGHIQGLPAPELPALDGIRVYPPQQTGQAEMRGQRLTGERSWSYVLVPEAAGEWTIPALSLDYFDPSTAAYRRTETPPLVLAVEPGDSPPAVVEAPTATAPAATGDRAATERWRMVALVAVAGLALGLFALMLVWLWRRFSAGGSDSEKLLRERLSALPAGESPRRVAAAIEEAWRQFLADRWHIGPGQPSTQWSRLLEDRGADPAIASELVHLADDLHYLRYAPQLSSTDELRGDLVQRSLRLARSLR